MAGAKPSKGDPILADLLDRLEPVGGVTSRAMFGGHGLYQDGEIFACYFQGRLYLKCDEATRDRFRALGSRPFEPMGNKGPTMAKYWEVPVDVLEDPRDLVDAVRSSLRARAGASKPRGGRKTTP